MYYVKLGPITYAKPLTLVEALRELRGTGDAKIVRADGTVAVDQAGSDTILVHAPTSRRIYRRPTRWASAVPSWCPCCAPTASDIRTDNRGRRHLRWDAA